MDRFYKTIRFAAETKCWLNELVEYRSKKLQEQNIQEDMERTLHNNYAVDGVAVTLTLNVTTGSIIEYAVKEAENVTPEEWEMIALEVEEARTYINTTIDNSSTPKVYLSQESYNKLEALRRQLRRKGKRLPLMSYVIKLVVYHLYEKLIIAGTE